MHSLKQMDKELPDVLQALVIFVMAGCTHLGVFSARTRHKSSTTSMNKGFTITSNLNTLPVKKMSHFYRLCLRWPYYYFLVSSVLLNCHAYAFINKILIKLCIKTNHICPCTQITRRYFCQITKRNVRRSYLRC